MALVPPVTIENNPELEQLARFFNETLGFTPNSVLTMQRVPGLAEAFVQLNKAVMTNHGKLTSELKRLIAYLCSAQSGCRYCEAHTILAAQRYGASNDRIEHIWDFRSSDLFTPAECAAFEFALAASSVPNAVDDAVSTELKKHWSEEDVLEILAVVALFGYLNRWNDSMGTTLEAGAEQAASEALAARGWERGKH